MTWKKPAIDLSQALESTSLVTTLLQESVLTEAVSTVQLAQVGENHELSIRKKHSIKHGRL